MVRIRDVARTFAALAVLLLAGSRPVLAGAIASPITLTGNVANDFTANNGSIAVPVDQGPGVIAGPDGSTANQLVAGVDIQNIWLNYNAASDTMYVGIQGYKNVAGQEEIFGDDSGNTNPLADANSSSTNEFGGLKSFAITFAPLTHNAAGQAIPGTPTIIAGVPQDKSLAGTGTTDGFTVSHYNGNTLLEMAFGQQIANSGNMAFNPSAATPDAEFTITNFSKISGVNPANGFYLQAYSGTPGNTEGKVQTSWIYSPAPQDFNTPEPTTWVAWMLLAGGAAWRSRRRPAARP
jgi:MYXO-CTERM domain-containing protein